MGVRFYRRLCLSVSLSDFPHDISKTNAARITKPATEMFKVSPGNFLFWGSKGQRSRSRVIKKLPAWVFALLWVLASSSWCPVAGTTPNLSALEMCFIIKRGTNLHLLQTVPQHRSFCLPKQTCSKVVGATSSKTCQFMTAIVLLSYTTAVTSSSRCIYASYISSFTWRFRYSLPSVQLPVIAGISW